VRRPIALFIALCVVALAVATGASAADRMWIGFHDDPVMRFNPDRIAQLDRARKNNATIVRTLVEWHRIAPTRPANPTDPFDPAYRFEDIDDLVRNAQTRGLEVLMTIWGTPAWANGNKKPPWLPTRMSDFQNFARALAARYSGRNAGYPFVRFYGIWNESNLGNFLMPQFNASGKIVSPANYARLAAAGYAGLKAGNRRALVSIGETSSNGRNKKTGGATDSVRPGTFAQGIARANKRIKFDAWAQHPYPVPVNQKPTQKVLYPNVTLMSLPRFSKDLDTWFGRKNIPIWITEYGHETKPGEPKGVTEAQQAAYARQSISIARKNPRVQMFVWFVMQDSTGSLWQSGLYRGDGSTKPAQSRWAGAAAPVNARNGKLVVRGGTKRPMVTVYLREFCANNAAGAAVGSISRVKQAGRLVGVTQAQLGLAIDCTVKLRLPVTVAKRKAYTATIELNTLNGDLANRTITVVGA
jgi:cellulase (glycosyl hydrolase family 5)